MKSVEVFEKEYKINQAKFEQIFSLSDEEIKLLLLNRFNGKIYEIITSDCMCRRIIENSEPVRIEFWYYDGVIIDYRGIVYQPEHEYQYVICPISCI